MKKVLFILIAVMGWGMSGYGQLGSGGASDFDGSKGRTVYNDVSDLLKKGEVREREPNSNHEHETTTARPIDQRYREIQIEMNKRIKGQMDMKNWFGADEEARNREKFKTQITKDRNDFKTVNTNINTTVNSIESTKNSFKSMSLLSKTNPNSSNKNSTFGDFMDNFLSMSNLNKDDIKEKANNRNINDLEALVANIKDWEKAIAGGKAAMIENLINKYLSQQGITNFLEFLSPENSKSDFKYIVTPNNSEESIGGCFMEGGKAKILLNANYIANSELYEVITLAIHEAYHAYQFYNMEKYKELKELRSELVKAQNKGYQVVEQGIRKKITIIEKALEKIGESVVEQWERDYLREVAINNERKTATEQRKQQLDEEYRNLDIEKTANKEAAIITIALQNKIYKWKVN